MATKATESLGGLRRTSVFLGKAQLKRLAEVGAKEGLSSAVIVRLAVNRWLADFEKQHQAA
jgi:hypothetical protein